MPKNRLFSSITRRELLLQGAAALPAFAALGQASKKMPNSGGSRSGAAAASSEHLLFAGTYTGKGSKGIYLTKFNSDSGRIAEFELAAETESPSFLAIHPNRRFLYAVNEVDKFQGQNAGSVSSFTMDHVTGKLTPLNRVSSRGSGPCHVALDRTGKTLGVANYGAGSFAVYGVGSTGMISAGAQAVKVHGKGPNKERQEAPHTHSVNFSPDNATLIVADLGTDQLLIYHLKAATAGISPADPPVAMVEPGSGPRHAAFSHDGKYFYVLNEIVSTLTTFSFDAAASKLTRLGSTTTLPAGFHGENTTAEVAIDHEGRFLYASNRGHDSLAIFDLAKPEEPHLIGNVSTGGKEPRHFTLDPTGKWVLAANQESDNVVVFSRDRSTGQLKPTGQELRLSKPVCLVF